METKMHAEIAQAVAIELRFILKEGWTLSQEPNTRQPDRFRVTAPSMGIPSPTESPCHIPPRSRLR